MTVTQVAGRRRTCFDVKPGWNRLPVELAARGTLRVRDRRPARGRRRLPSSAGGLREVRVPGLRVRERLRPPVRVERALRGADLSPLAADLPVRAHDGRRAVPARPGSRRRRAATGQPRRGRGRAGARRAGPRDAGSRALVSLPAARAWRRRRARDGRARAPTTACVDRLAGVDLGGAVVASSGRFEGRPGYRASRGFRRRPGARRGWRRGTARASAWLAWRTPRAADAAVAAARARPRSRRGRRTRVRLTWPGGRSGGAARSQASGAVALPRPVRAARFRLEVLRRSARARPAWGSASSAARACRGRAASARRVRRRAVARRVASGPGGVSAGRRGDRSGTSMRAGRCASSRAPGRCRCRPGTPTCSRRAATCGRLTCGCAPPRRGRAPPAAGGGRVLDPGDGGPRVARRRPRGRQRPELARARRELEPRLARHLRRPRPGRARGRRRLRERLARRPRLPRRRVRRSRRSAR